MVAHQGTISDLPKIFKWAKIAQEMSTHSQFKLGAVIIKNSRVISKGCNFEGKTHPLLHKEKETFYESTSWFVDSVHAEFHAIMRAVNKGNLKGSTIVVFRTTSDGKLALSRPCNSCQLFLKKFGVKKMIYTTPDGWAEEKI